MRIFALAWLSAVWNLRAEHETRDELMLMQRIDRRAFDGRKMPLEETAVDGEQSAGCAYAIPQNAGLLVIDMQNDFIRDWGTLQVTDGNTIIPLINSLTKKGCKWSKIVFTQDFHPFNHVSFASMHAGVSAFGFVNLTYANVKQGNPVLCDAAAANADTWGASATANCSGNVTTLQQQVWPDHCIQGTKGMDIDSRVEVRSGAVIAKKGYSSIVDSYGVIEDNLGISESNVASIFSSAGVENVFVVGLAYDYCVKHSAIQSADHGFKTTVLIDGTKAVDPDTVKAVTHELKAAGVKVKESTILLKK
eukprot:TRINITY_DN21031_c0_g1_i1.p1 TRINITY_DN21031_c0_g1~~TRINITY_DN21031_c0_g1_i1.p1  ORF type:complete len:324 (+),score=55.28 TRINITY_DN21031_c0_g1_i1:56-973(+)